MKKIFFVIFVLLSAFGLHLHSGTVYARPCYVAPDGSTVCPPSSSSAPDAIERIFGKIQPPDPLKGFLEKDPTGAGAISQFLSNLVALIFSLAIIVLIFMILWGGFDWLISGGDKEKIASAQRKIINAIIGIIIFAIAFAVIRVLGAFTGFTFFKW